MRLHTRISCGSWTTWWNHFKRVRFKQKQKNVNLIALEDVTDPRNIGSIIRSAVAFSVDGQLSKKDLFHLKVNFTKVQVVERNFRFLR